MLNQVLSIAVVALAVIAGVLDWRQRRIPNWLTVPATFVGILLNTRLQGWDGTRRSLLGLALGLGLLLPLVLLRGLGAGDWKLAGAVGAIVGPSSLIAILVIAIIVAGIMAMVLIVYSRRTPDAIANTKALLCSLVWLRMPALSIEQPDALKIPFGVSMAIGVVAYIAGQILTT